MEELLTAAANTEAAAVGADARKATAGELMSALENIQAGMQTQKKQLRTRNILLAAIAAIFLFALAVLVTAAISVVPRVNETMASIKLVADGIEDDKIMRLVDDISTVADSAQGSLDAVNVIIEDAGTTMEEASAAVQQLEKIDIATLNKAIQNLNDAVEPMASFFNRFK